MTKQEIRKAIKKEFFTKVCEMYPGTVVDHSEGGRYCIDIPSYGQYEMSGGSYWDICTYDIPWATPSLAQDAYHKKCKDMEATLQKILDNIVEVLG
jgi:hypothetical protein